MNGKTIVSLIGLSTLLLSSSGFAFAQTTTPTGETKREARLDANLQTIKSRGDQLITERITSLNNMLTQINNAKRLSTTQKNTYTTNINNAVSGLTNLKSKIDADTDGVTARADVKSIYTQFRIYAVFDPQTHELAASDAMTEATDQLTQLAAKLQARITQASSAGNAVTQLNTLLTEMQNKIADAKTQYTTAENAVSGLTPDAYNQNPSTVTTILKNARASLKTGRTDLQTALQDAKQIVVGLKALKTTTTVTPASGSATVTP